MQAKLSLTVERWREAGILLASSAPPRRAALAEIFATDDITTVSIPDATEGRVWEFIASHALCCTKFSGSVHQVARAKLLAMLDQTKESVRVGFGMDTVPFILDEASSGSVAEDKGMTRQFWAFHKPRSEELAKVQLTKVFTSVVEGYRHRKAILQAMDLNRSVKEDIIIERKMIPYLPGESEKARIDFRKRTIANYIACVVRVVTGLAMYIPELHEIVTQSPYCDIVFDVFADWVDQDMPESEMTRRIILLVDEVLQLQREVGINPLLVPGALDYSQVGSNEALNQALQWRVVDHCTKEEYSPKEICMGAPKATIRDMVEHASNAVISRQSCPFPEGFVLGMTRVDLQRVQAFQTSLQWDIVERTIEGYTASLRDAVTAELRRPHSIWRRD